MKISIQTQFLVGTCFVISLLGVALVGWQFDLSYQKQQRLNQIEIEVNEIKHLQGMLNHFMTTIDLFFSQKQSYLVVGIKRQYQQLDQRINNLQVAAQPLKLQLSLISKVLDSSIKQVERAALTGPKSEQSWSKILQQLDAEHSLLIGYYQTLQLGIAQLRSDIKQELDKQRQALFISFLCSTFLTLAILIALGILNSRKIIKPINNLYNLTKTDKELSTHSFEKAPEEIKEIANTLVNHVDRLATGKLKAEQDKVQIARQNDELQHTISMLEHTRQQLVQTEKLASLGQLAAGVAHEINNPVAYVMANTENLTEYFSAIQAYIKFAAAKDTTEAQRQAAYLKNDIAFILEELPHILQSSEKGLDRVKNIVRDLRVFSHEGEECSELIDPNELVTQAFTLAEASISSKVQLQKNIEEPVFPFTGVKSRLIQVLLNLIINADDAIENHGKIEVNVRYNKLREQIDIAISDTGCGISQQHLKRVFDPFFTTKPVGKGTGLGLHICHSIISSHQAEIAVTTELGQGSCFTLSFAANTHS